jgi:hypothetical protein
MTAKKDQQRAPRDDQGGKSVGLERRGNEFLDRVSGEVNAVPWHITLLELAWTAGPATLFAAWLGYYLGFGKTVPTESLIFFVAYTVILGFVGVATRVVTQATYGKRKRKARGHLLVATDVLPDLIATSRDLYLASLEPVSRRYEASEMLLRRVDLDAASVMLVVEQLTANQDLAQAAARIEMFRRNGLFSRVQEEVTGIGDPAREAIAEIQEYAPAAAAALADRLAGRLRDQEHGLPRDDNFAERILAAVDQDNEDLMTLLDAEEMFILVFELLVGRRITVLTFTYRGRWELARATDQLEERRNRYRISKLTGYSRLKALVALLNSSEAVHTAGRGHQGDNLLHVALEGIQSVNGYTEQLAQQVASGDLAKRRQLRRCVMMLQSTLRLVAAMRRAFNHAGQRHALFLRTIDNWNQLIRPGERTLGMDDDSGGLRIEDQTIALNDEAKLKLAQWLCEYLKEEGISSDEQRLVREHRGHKERISADDVKGIAIALASALSEYIDLSRPEIQRAINNSDAANLGAIEPSLSANTKAGWGEAIVNEVREDLGKSAELLAATLVRRYGVRLSGEAIDLLEKEYGARRERLTALRPSQGSAMLGAVTSLDVRPPPAIDGDASWQRELTRARRLVDRYL